MIYALAEAAKNIKDVVEVSDRADINFIYNIVSQLLIWHQKPGIHRLGFQVV